MRSPASRKWAASCSTQEEHNHGPGSHVCVGTERDTHDTPTLLARDKQRGNARGSSGEKQAPVVVPGSNWVQRVTRTLNRIVSALGIASLRALWPKPSKQNPPHSHKSESSSKHDDAPKTPEIQGLWLHQATHGAKHTKFLPSAELPQTGNAGVVSSGSPVRRLQDVCACWHPAAAVGQQQQQH